ncbi:MAG: penicillin-binding protein 1C [Chloroflexi bacterium]|nr:penicillin-binding protein 1C [Chloroflexota bacterium]
MRKLSRLSLLILVLALVTGINLYQWLFADLPAPDELGDRLAMPSVRIVDRAGRPLYDIMDPENGRHANLPLAQISLTLQQATIAVEDKNFYQNPGVDVIGIVRAFWINLRGGEVLAGGSAITQQVARNLLLDADERIQRTVRRKLRESWLAIRMTRELKKNDILALYLNQMYYGAMAYGVEAAAQTYFGKTAVNLTLAESALLAGLTQAPAVYNPFANPEAAKARQIVVLNLMRQENYITDTEYDLAVREPLRYAATPYPIRAPHFVMMVQAEADALFSQEEIYRRGGLTIRTTLDLTWQEQAERIIGEQLQRLNSPPDGGPSHNAHNAALVAVNPVNGAILALAGNADYFDADNSGAVNMALTPRQPGSALKPIVYAAALSPGQPDPFTAATMLPDVRTVFMTHEDEPYVPVNFSRDEHGPVLLRQALASSLNIPAVLTLDVIGVETAMDLAADMGITTLGEPNEYDLSFALGGGPAPLLDLTVAYAAFANGGSRIAPNLILDVTDAAGDVVYTAVPPQPTRVLDERIAWLISDILSDNEARMLSFGANSVLQLDRPAAVKTGTTNDFHDNWTVGYTPELVVGVWVGNASGEPMVNVSGVSGAGPIWHYFMRAALSGQPETDFIQPPGLVQAEVCALSGLLPGEDCPYRRREWFLAGTQPTATDSFFQRVVLDTLTERLADETTPPERRSEQLALNLPPTLHPWARAEGLLLLANLTAAGGESGGTETAVSANALRLISPDPNTIYRISSQLPPEAQKLRFEAVAGENLSQVTLWVNDKPLATITEPPFEAWQPIAPGQHTAWADGRDAAGNRITSERISFEVRAAEE